jgi:hypothetical protein
VAQGIPEGMTFLGIPAWMAVNGKTAAEIGGYTARVRVARTRLTNIECRRPWVRDEDVVASGVRGRAEQAAYASLPLPHETLTIDLRAQP